MNAHDPTKFGACIKNRTIQELCRRTKQIDKREQGEQESRVVVTIPYLKGLSEQFRRSANRHCFRVAFKPGRKIKDIKRTCQEPLGERQKCVVYKIPCACQNTVYVGETWRLFQTRKKKNTWTKSD